MKDMTENIHLYDKGLLLRLEEQKYNTHFYKYRICF